MPAEVYTIGYSNRGFQEFASILNRWGITAVADVRSQPYSRSNPDFAKDTLKEMLERSGTRYVFLGEELGARTNDPACYVDSKVQYDRLASTPSFQAGLDRVEKGATEFKIALMCAEKEPLECHRCILVARCLVRRSIQVRHILDAERIEPHDLTMMRLIRNLGIPDDWTTQARESRMDLAYRIQGERIAFRIESENAQQYALWGDSQS